MHISNAKIEVDDGNPTFLHATLKISYDVVFSSSEGEAAKGMHEFITLYGRDGSKLQNIGFDNQNPWYQHYTSWGSGSPSEGSPWHRVHYRTHFRTELNEDSWLDGLQEGWSSRDELLASISVSFEMPEIEAHTTTRVSHEFGFKS